jgi:Carboxypeptidase regulatory-like domain/TonB dependent receptor
MKAIRILLMLPLAATFLFGQATSQIQGTVQDSSGAAVPGAAVKATQTDTGIVRATSSDSDGSYVLADLPIGPYRLEVGKEGFTSYVQTGIVLQVATNPTITVVLQLGRVSETVQVEANAAQVETENTSVGTVIENQRILDLPLNGRQATDLIQLTGAAIPSGVNGTAGFPGGQNIAIAGGLLSGVGYFLDGTIYNNPFDATNLPFPFPDALEEFKVETSTLTAQNGMHSAAAINAVVKSGTNNFHGDAFEFLRNGDMNARNFFATSRDTLKRNQFGGTIGGPIKKDKIFFFAGYQGTITRQDPTDTTSFVPTSQMLAGNFSTWEADCNGNKVLSAPYVNNVLPPSLISPQALAIAKLLPAPNNPNDPCGKVIYGAVTQINQHQALGRTDYQINSKQSIFGRYMATTYVQPPAYGLQQDLLASSQGGLNDLAQSATIGHTYLISPKTINVFRIAYNRVGVHRDNDNYFSGCDIGVDMYCYIPHQTVVSVTGGPGIGISTAIAASFIPSTWTIEDDVSLVRGAHQFAFGVSAFRYQSSSNANVYSAGSFGFTGAATGAGLADFVAGELDSFTQGVPNNLFVTKWYAGLYGQDTWKISPHFTATLGLRWEPFLPQRVNNGAIYSFSLSRLEEGIKSTVFQNAPAGLLYAGDPGFPGKAGINNRYDQFAPRLGLAWDPQGNGKMSIRASFGTSFDFPNVMIYSTEATAPPFGDQTTITGPVPFANPFANTPGGNFFPVTFNATAPFTPAGTFVAVEPNMKATTVYSWNLAAQRQITNTWFVAATYAGSESEHIWVTYQLNPAILVPNVDGTALGTCPAKVTTGCDSTSNTQQRRVVSILSPANGSYLGPVDQFDSSGTASYEALILRTHHTLSKRVSLDANYTWSHCIGDATQASTVGGAEAGLLEPNDRRFDRGNCQTGTLGGTFGLDRRQMVNFTAVAQSPVFTNRLLRAAGTGWTLAGSWRANSHGFLTPTYSTDIQLSGTGGQRPNQILPDPLCANPRPTCWINPAAFAQPAYGTLGDLGRSSVPAPTFWEIDASLSRDFRIRERQTIQFRLDAFNVTNSFRAGVPSGLTTSGGSGVTTTVNSAQFGQILSAMDPRILQVAGKFVF